MDSSLELCNLSCSVQEERMIFWFDLNIENKDAINRIFSKLKARELYKFFSELPSDYRVWLARFAYYRPKNYEQDVSELKLQDIASYVVLRRIRLFSWNNNCHNLKMTPDILITFSQHTLALARATTKYLEIRRCLGTLLLE